MSIEKRTAVISGATGGLGSVLVRDLAARGANLGLLDRDSEKLSALVQKLDLPAEKVAALTVDLLNPGETQAAANAVAGKFGRVDILLHVVGGWTGGKSLVEAPRRDLELMLNQHIWSSFNVTQAFVPHLIQNGWGRIVMVSSPSAEYPAARGGPYAIAKAGQEALMLTLSQELKGSGVTANVLRAKTIDVRGEKVSAPSAENSAWTTPEELSAAVLYLISDEAGTLNGAKIPMYGSYR